MNCIIPGPNLKVFAKSLHCLARIGDDLYIEGSKDQLRLITLNLRKTVCVKYNFLEIFFSNYEIDENGVGDKTNSISCKMHLKTLLPLFKGTHLEKKLDYIKIEYENNSDFIVFKLKYNFDDVLMTHKLRLMESETLTIGISSDSGCNNIITTSTLCNHLLNMFSNSDDEILFEITKDMAVVRNYYVGAPLRPKFVRSQVNVNRSEFTMFQIEQENSVNFSLKPFRTAIQFAEAFNLNISLNFEKGGKPLSIVIKNPTFEANYIVATINPYTDNQSTMTTSIPTKITQANGDLTQADQEAILNENWDDFVPELPITHSAKSNNDRELGFREIIEQTRSKNSTKRIKLMDVEDNVEKSPESPKIKRARLVFGRCFESTFRGNYLGDVLVPNSDSE